MSDSYTRVDLDEEVNKVMEDNTEQDLSTVNDSELTTDTEADNNKGKSDDFHFFGIEIGHESTPDEPVKGLDFTASYENIVCRNIVTGSNYAGVFLAVESYCNDVFDNTILGSEWYAIECHSNMFNSMLNNIMDQEILNLYAR